MKRTWSEDELCEHWSLSTEEQALLTRKTSRGQLGFAVLLKYFQMETRFPRDRRDIPPAVIDSLAVQLGTTPETLEDYDWYGHTGRLHRQSIREWLGFRTPTADDAARLITWLRIPVIPATQSSAKLPPNPIEACYPLGAQRRLGWSGYVEATSFFPRP